MTKAIYGYSLWCILINNLEIGNAACRVLISIFFNIYCKEITKIIYCKSDIKPH